MPELFQNKYRISSSRLGTWDYASEGMYFVTICTAYRVCYFGDIGHPTEIGKIAETEWIKTLELRPDMNIEMGEFVVMPNHFHGIIIIGANEYNGDIAGGNGRDAMHRVSTCDTFADGNKFGPQSKNLASILRGYKSAVTTHARKNDIPFGWQSRFHDHVIRSEDECNRISNYIVNNPTNCSKDKFHSKENVLR